MNASKADKHPRAHSAGDTAHAQSKGLCTRNWIVALLLAGY
jgi:hypothetical protein